MTGAVMKRKNGEFAGQGLADITDNLDLGL